MDTRIRSYTFIDWDTFLEEGKKDAIFTLDFQIDAGFSFSNAIAERKSFKKRYT